MTQHNGDICKQYIKLPFSLFRSKKIFKLVNRSHQIIKRRREKMTLIMLVHLEQHLNHTHTHTITNLDISYIDFQVTQSSSLGYNL